MHSQIETIVTVEVTFGLSLKATQMAAVALPVNVVTKQLSIMATESFMEGMVTALMAQER